jgi:hypothetical protein
LTINGAACLGVTRASSCSAVIDFSYSLTGSDAAGLPRPGETSQSPWRPIDLKMARNLPMYESKDL